jgi:dipeptide/tripeptide permease
VYHLLAVFPAAALTIPFMIVYFQVSTVFVVQGEAMRVVGPFNASMMNIFDPISVCICGTLTSTFLFPFLDKKGLHFKYSHRFALGTAISALAVLMAIIIDRRIHDQLNQGKFHSMNIFWQVIVYFLVGAGEIFATAVGYDVAFKIAPKEQKGLASGINLFVIGAIPNFISVGLYKRCSSWFPIDPNIAEDYASSQLSKYLWVLFGIAIFGVVFNLLPQVSNLLESTINRSIEINAKEGSKKIAEEDGDLEDVRIRESSDCVETPGIEA